MVSVTWTKIHVGNDSRIPGSGVNNLVFRIITDWLIRLCWKPQKQDQLIQSQKWHPVLGLDEALHVNTRIADGCWDTPKSCGIRKQCDRVTHTAWTIQQLNPSPRRLASYRSGILRFVSSSRLLWGPFCIMQLVPDPVPNVNPTRIQIT